MSKDVKNVLDEQFENEVEDTIVEVDDEEVDLEELSNEELIDIIRGLSYELDKKDDSEQRVNEFALEREKIRAKYEDDPERKELSDVGKYTPSMKKAVEIGESFQIFVKYGIALSSEEQTGLNLKRDELNYSSLYHCV